MLTVKSEDYITEAWHLMDITWAGGKDTVIYCAEADKLNELLELIEEYSGVWTDGELNDFLWFQRDMILEQLGIEL